MTFEQLLSLVRECPPGTLIPTTVVADALGNHSPSQSPDANIVALLPAQSWRENLWAVPAETRLGIDQLCEAISRKRSWCYRHTSRKSDLPRIPHRKLDGQLVFVAGEIRTWIQRNEIIVERGAQPMHLLELRKDA